jgi:uncharacterized PurR-regulated membrane protein YhhQ (DUF165 family)
MPEWITALHVKFSFHSAQWTRSVPAQYQSKDTYLTVQRRSLPSVIAIKAAVSNLADIIITHQLRASHGSLRLRAYPQISSTTAKDISEQEVKQVLQWVQGDGMFPSRT